MSSVAIAWSLKKGVNPILDLYSKEKIDEAVGAVGLDSSDEDVKALEDCTRRGLWHQCGEDSVGAIPASLTIHSHITKRKVQMHHCNRPRNNDHKYDQLIHPLSPKPSSATSPAPPSTPQ